MDRRLQLLYWNGGNFGDDLNIWLWRKLIPHVVDTEHPFMGKGDRTLFLGIGTIFLGAMPFLAANVTTMFLCIVFPELVLWLPNWLMG